MCAQTNPSFSWGSSFDDDFGVGSDSVLGVDFIVNMDCVLGRIQASDVKEVSVLISESGTTQFSLSISESTGYHWADESRRHLLR